jgi:hypothetical protein
MLEFGCWSFSALMSLAVTIDVSDHATPVVRAIGRALAPERLNPVVGKAAVNAFRASLFEANRTKPNALGGTRTNFYQKAGGNVHFDDVGDGVLISVNALGIRQRVLGGTIKPKTAKFLTIPARAEAHGKRAREFGEDLVVVFGSGGRPIGLARRWKTTLSVRRDKTTGSRIGMSKKSEVGGEILFWLVKSVTQRGDPSIMPTEAALSAAIFKDVESYVQRIAARAADQLKA